MGHSAKTEKGSFLVFEPEKYNKMGSHGSKQTIHNGYSRHSKLSLTTLKWHSKLFRAGISCQTESSSMRWRKYQGQGLQHNSASVRDCSRECSFVENLHQTQTPLPLRKSALDLPTQFTGQKNCGVPVCVVAQQSSSVRESQAPGQTEVNEYTFDKYTVDSARQNFPKSMGHAAEDSDGSGSMQIFFSTEVPQNITINYNKSSHRGDLQNMSDNREQSLNGETYIFKSKKIQSALKDQIHKVVVNLEEVLRGLKEVHLEMKEVVQQIDQLTSSIDLGEDDSRGASGHCSPNESISTSQETKYADTNIHNFSYTNNHGFVSTVREDTRGLKACSKDQTPGKSPPKVGPPAYTIALSSINNSKQKINHKSTVSHTKGPKSEVNAPSRSQRPPPYPFDNRTWRTNKEKSLPYAGRRRLLSTTV
ncbi:hypothetical protein Baya_3279 [Bagarius yarrelli]|uniref:Protein Largen n=1 Tax=Bagarius yarrelli TaxID=175774 RepID=A0A556TS75_BAGYA|nr:hypothetical protein Baya_3279 [Bagarius yarrelli]